MTTGEAVTVSLCGTDRSIPPLNAERGLLAAEMLVPFLITLRPAIEEIAADRAAGREGRSYTEIGMDVGVAILPQLKAGDILRLGHLLTGIEQDELAAAPLAETLEAIIVAGRAIDLKSLVATATKLMGMMGKSEVEPPATPTRKPKG